MNRTVPRAALIAAMFALLLAACGGEDSESAQPATANEAASPSPAVTALKVYLDSASRNPLNAVTAARLQNALVAAGYSLVTSESAPHDVAARLVVTATQEQSLFQVTVNGQRQLKLQVHAALTISGGGSVVDQVAHDFESTNGEVSDEDLAPLVARLNRSPRLSRYASARAKARQAQVQAEQVAAAQAQQQAEQTNAEQARQQEELDWVQARPIACRMPSRITACDAVQAYLAKYPSGKHVDDAQNALAAAKPKLEALQRDENAWSRAGADACSAHADPHACDGVDLYLVKFPAGLHADEARGLTARSQP